MGLPGPVRDAIKYAIRGAREKGRYGVAAPIGDGNNLVTPATWDNRARQKWTNSLHTAEIVEISIADEAILDEIDAVIESAKEDRKEDDTLIAIPRPAGYDDWNLNQTNYWQSRLAEAEFQDQTEQEKAEKKEARKARKEAKRKRAQEETQDDNPTGEGSSRPQKRQKRRDEDVEGSDRLQELGQNEDEDARGMLIITLSLSYSSVLMLTIDPFL